MSKLLIFRLKYLSSVSAEPFVRLGIFQCFGRNTKCLFLAMHYDIMHKITAVWPIRANFLFEFCLVRSYTSLYPYSQFEYIAQLREILVCLQCTRFFLACISHSLEITKLKKSPNASNRHKRRSKRKRKHLQN